MLGALGLRIRVEGGSCLVDSKRVPVGSVGAPSCRAPESCT